MNTDKLITDNMGFVVSMAKQYAGRGVDLDDLVSEGCLAMVECAPRFDDQRGVPFVRFASAHVRRAMERAINPHKAPLSVDEPRPLGSKTSFTLLTVIENQDAPSASSIMERSERLALLERRLKGLPERDRQVLTLLYGFDGEEKLSMAEVGVRMGLKRERVRQVRDHALRALRKQK